MTERSILDGVRERFEASTDFTIGLEEEYQLLDPETLALRNDFERIVDAAPPKLQERLAGELIASEIEFKTGAHDRFADAALELVNGRIATLDLIAKQGLVAGVSGVHPFSVWQDQRIIDTPHYRLLQDDLGYVAWTNNTWSVHLHCGIRGADRALAVMTAMRSLLPHLLALSANSSIFMGRDTRLASARTQVFVKSFPRCGISDPYPDWDAYARHVRLLEATQSVIKATQIWWSVRPHHEFGTVEVRICDGQTEMEHAVGVAAMALACIALLCARYDVGEMPPIHPRDLIDENIWRAQRYGLEGDLIDPEAGTVTPTPRAIEDLIAQSSSQIAALGLEPYIDHVRTMLRDGNGAMRQREVFAASGGDAHAVQADIVERTRTSAMRLRDELVARAGR